MSPDKYLTKKFYDPFSGKMLESHYVDLIIEHPRFGVVSVVVNKKTKEQYNDPQRGPRSFNFNNFSSRPKYQSYLIRGDGLKGCGIDYCNGFVIFDTTLFYTTFCRGSVYFDDISLYNKNDQTNNGNTSEHVTEGELLISEVRGGVQTENCEIVERENVSSEDVVGDPIIVDSCESTIPKMSQQIESSEAQHVEPASESNASYGGTLD